ncbi:MAG: CopD family protein [Croceibacterium sp.]
MQDVLQVTYYWLKAGHIIFVIFWMAGLFMLPRLFVYHQECEPGSPENARWIARERKLISIIMNPSVAVVWILGMSLVFAANAWDSGWLWAKLGLVAGLTYYHVYLVQYAWKLERGERRLSGKALRLLNEVPGVAVALIVVLVVVKPF